MADHFRLDDQGRIVELTVFFRPLPSLAVAVRAIGAAVGRTKSPLRGKIMRLFATPLVAQTRSSDRFADRLVRSALR
jgi:hypothetical protein